MTNGAIYCNRCGSQNSALAKFCANCGTPFSSEVQPAVPPAAAPEVSPRPQSPAWQPPAVSYSASTSTIHYGGFWIRFVAVIIDLILLGAVIWPVSAIFAVAIGLAGGSVSMPMIGVDLVRGIVRSALFLCAGWIYRAQTGPARHDCRDAGRPRAITPFLNKIQSS